MYSFFMVFGVMCVGHGSCTGCDMPVHIRVV